MYDFIVILYIRFIMNKENVIIVSLVYYKGMLRQIPDLFGGSEMNSLGSSSEIVQNKLIIMYIMDKLNMPVSNNDLTTLVLETRLMNYFVFQQCFNELLDGMHIKPAEIKKAESSIGSNVDRSIGGNASSIDSSIGSTKGSDSVSGFVITPAGKKALQYFINLISPGIRKQLDNMLPGAKKQIESEMLISADFVPESENKFTVICRIGEKDFPLIELKAAVGTRKDARAVCESWEKHSSEIYSEIIDSLTKKRG